MSYDEPRPGRSIVGTNRRRQRWTTTFSEQRAKSDLAPSSCSEPQLILTSNASKLIGRRVRSFRAFIRLLATRHVRVQNREADALCRHLQGVFRDSRSKEIGHESRIYRCR